MATGSKSGECVRVMVRIRPMSSKEKQDTREKVATANFDRAEVTVKNPVGDASEPPKTFTFDAAFPYNTTQQQVYDTAATEIVEAVMDGYNGTIFAYGQTGAGKSHTMEGYPDPPELRGIIPNSFKHIFDKVAIAVDKNFLVRASYLEIYNEEIRDLLGKDPKNRLDLKENMDTGVYVKDLTSIVVKDAAEIDHVMQTGKKNRSVGSTLMNQTSSRSHSIFAIVVECASEGIDGNEHICVGKLNLVDLAGSERQSKTGATGDRLKEATKINLSLSALGNVISALVDGKSQHIPYRDSKLTRLLQDSLGGNTKTVMIANCGPADYNYEETVTTLRYASRAKNIKNKPKINEDPKDAMLREFQEEIKRLKDQLEKTAAEGNDSGYVTQVIDGKEVQIPVGKEVIEVEKVVEKIVIEKGVSEEQLKAMEERARKEKEEFEKMTKEEIALLNQDKARAEVIKKEIQMKLQEEKEKQEKIEAQKQNLSGKLAEMEAKLLVGGKMMDKASKQEQELRKAAIELEDRKRQELLLARELAEKEEAKLWMEEQYNSLQEEAEAKTKKLKKVWTKVKEVQTEVKHIQEGFNREREDMLDTIRELTGQLKLKTLVLDYFIPREAMVVLEGRARWDEEVDEWHIDHLELAGNSVRPRQRPASASGLRRPETTEKNRQKMMGPNPAMDEDSEYNIIAETPIRSPYLVYKADENGEGFAYSEADIGGERTSSNTTTSSKKSRRKGSASSSRRPSTAGRKRA